MDAVCHLLDVVVQCCDVFLHVHECVGVVRDVGCVRSFEFEVECEQALLCFVVQIVLELFLFGFCGFDELYC